MKAASSERRVVGTVFIAALLLYLSFPSQYFNFDGIACAIAVELGDFKHLVHGNHLAYGIVGWAFDRAWRLLGYGGRAIVPLQALDALLGAAGAAAFASLLRRAGRPEREAWLGGAAVAVSSAWWFWSLEAQVYMLGAFFATLAAREALGEKPNAARLGAWHGLAVLGHVGHAMALPALAYILTRKLGRKALSTYVGALAGVVSAAYAAACVFAVRPQSLADVKTWLLGSAALTADRSFAWHGGSPIAAIPAWLSSMLRIFLDFTAVGQTMAVAAVVLALVPVAAGVMGGFRRSDESRFWLAWLAGYAALYLTWEPSTVVYRISDLVALWALALSGAGTIAARARGAALLGWVAVAFAYNFIFTVSPASRASSNADLVEARWTSAHAPAEAWILATSRGVVYLPYFTGLKAMNLHYLNDDASLFARLDALRASGATVMATDRTLRQTGLLASAQRYGSQVAATGDGFELLRLGRGLK